MSVKRYLGVAALFAAAVVTIKSCTEAFVTKADQEGTKFEERFGHNLSENTIGFVKGLFKGGVDGLGDITDETKDYLMEEHGIDVGEYDNLSDLENALRQKGIDISFDGNPCNDETYFLNSDCFDSIPQQERVPD